MTNMNTLAVSFQLPCPYSPPLIQGESEDTDVSSDSPNNNNLFTEKSTCLSQKRKAGRKKFKETRHPIFHGVRERDGGKWVCEVREPNKKSRIWLGTYPNAELAARAHDVAALALRGDGAALNFPDSAQLAPRPKSSSAEDIRLAALQATRCDVGKREVKEESSRRFDGEIVRNGDEEEDFKELFIDEEAIFNMPSYFDCMAVGMLLTPPSLKRGIDWDEVDDYDNTSYMDLNLW